jgi:hypothetical protein
MQKGKERAQDQAGSGLTDGNTGARPVTG